MNTLVTLTDAAAEHIKTKVDANKNALGFRLSIKKTGCSGYAYQPAIIEKIIENDIRFTAQNGLEIFVDPSSKDFISGLVIDYVTDTNMGIKQKKLIYINPHEKNRCGCGESFTVD